MDGSAPRSSPRRITLNETLRSGKRVFSGIQPTGVLHLGNYLGAVRHWASLQEEHETIYCIVDLHALTQAWEPAELAERVHETAAMLVACGIDPERSILFAQSQVPEHAELSWVLTCIARMGELRRMIQFKEKSKGEAESVGVGLFTYPVLQAADVLLYRAHGVPVGEDQRQHIELMRDLAVRFNAAFGDTFVVPEAWIPPAGARIMALDDPTQKMSKSASRPNSSILLSDPPESLAKKIRSAVTDSGREVVAAPDKPALANLLTIFSLVGGRSMAELEETYSTAGYARFKQDLADAMIEALAPVRARYAELMQDPSEMSRLLERGSGRATEIAAQTMVDVRARVGLLQAAQEGRKPQADGAATVG